METRAGGTPAGASPLRVLPAEGSAAVSPRVLQALLESAARLGQPLALAELATLAVDEANRLLPGYHAFVALVDPESPGFVRFAAASGGLAEDGPEPFQPIEG